MTVYILKTQQEDEDPFGTECVFNTLMVGFPTAKIVVTENTDKVEHHEYVEAIVKSCAIDCPNEPIVFCDTDMIFYNNVEVYLEDIQQLYAGRLCPAYWNEVVGANECQRFHTSLLYIKSARYLMDKVNKVYTRSNFPYSAFAPARYTLGGVQYFHDTCGNLFHLLSPLDRYIFTPQMLDMYAHLVSGTMLNFVTSKMSNKHGLKHAHELAKKDPMSAHGNWREHNRYYAAHVPHLP